VVHPGTYRETVTVQASAAGLTLVGASADPRDAVIVYDNANGMHTRATYLGDWTPYAPQHE
jgi:pectin methylesterase-like acyl-CoA thioesterase